jgi:hypothetical protein
LTAIAMFLLLAPGPDAQDIAQFTASFIVR